MLAMPPSGDSEDNTFKPKSLVGMSLPVARDVAAQYDYRIRVVSEDGTSLVVTADARRDRINVSVSSGEIDRVISIG